MPRLTGSSLSVDNIKVDSDVKYNQPQDRYLRVAAYDCTVLSSHTISRPVTDGRPVRAQLSGATEDAYYIKQIQLPFGVLLHTLYVIHNEPGTETARSTITIRRINPTGDTVLGTQSIAHSNSSIVLDDYSILLGSHYDNQLTATPTMAADFYMIDLEFKQLWDTVVGGAQNHDFYGFILKYRHDPSGSVGVLRERT